jgi:hypothetical protein
VLEIEAHLELLVGQGELDRAEIGGRREYA